MSRPQSAILHLIGFGHDIQLNHDLVPASMRRAVQSANRALYDDGRLTPDAAVSLPWSRSDIFIPGAVATGANLISLAMPQGARLRHVALAARIPPTGGPLAIQLTGGPQSESFSLPAGQRTAATGVDIDVVPGVFASINVTAANGAEDVTISLHYSVGGLT